MNNLINKFVKKFLLRLNIKIEFITNDQQIGQFFKLMRPINTNLNLRRLGGNGDGGYLVPDDLIGITACFSPGVDISSKFELQLAEMGIPCHLADYSVDKPAESHPLFTFDKKFLGAADEGNYISLRTWVEVHSKVEGDMILQMDIEGSEYEVILSTSEELLSRFRIIIIEFHHLESLLNIAGNKLITLTFSKILKQFDIVHMHPNNSMDRYFYGEYVIPPIVEFTFLRKDRVKASDAEFRVPHFLDRPNVMSRPDYVLSNCWYRNSQN